ncbi:MAG: MBL fold metallo-hydrolase [Phycisphaerales bacterium]|jgi:7,8-dihydropterin-6-yl-methyl-4-(beta-D-ribofuranosyl)aminobenzene 5'-phosphate synthase
MRRLSAIVVFMLPAVSILLIAGIFLAESAQRMGQIMNEQNKTVTTQGIQNLIITVIFDNNPYEKELGTDWGFAALISGADKTILFDTGSGELLVDNMRKLSIEPNSVDVVVLSHIHDDHTGGLESFLKENSDVTVYLPKSFPKKFKDNVRNSRAKVIEVGEAVQVCENVYSTGVSGKLIKEQALMIRTDKGMVVMTGCAHPGIVNIVNKARELFKDDILLVMGGFHFEWTTRGRIEKVVSAFKELGIKYVGPCHCSGDKARDLFKKHFENNYIDIGAGKVMTLADLQ